MVCSPVWHALNNLCRAARLSAKQGNGTMVDANVGFLHIGAVDESLLVGHALRLAPPE